MKQIVRCNKVNVGKCYGSSCYHSKDHECVEACDDICIEVPYARCNNQEIRKEKLEKIKNEKVGL